MKITLTRVNIKSALGRVYMNPLCPRLTWLAAMLALACAAETGHAQSAGDVRRVSLQRQPLSQVMKQLAQTRHISLHYANSLAERPVGGDCPADPLPELITCLLGQAQNVIVRLSPGGKPAELWLISSGEPPGKFTSIEPELALESCSPLLRNGGRRALLFDIGGGSTELVWVRLTQRGRPELIGYVSLPVGVVTLAERFGSHGDDEAGFAAMRDDVADRLRPFESVHCIGHEIRQGGVHFLGTSGTVTTLAGIAFDLPRYSRPAVDGAVLPHADADAALRHLRALGRAGLAEHPCIGPERADFVLPGCAIFAAIHMLWPAPEIVVADRGLREGMLLRMIRVERTRLPRYPWSGQPVPPALAPA